MKVKREYIKEKREMAKCQDGEFSGGKKRKHE